MGERTFLAAASGLSLTLHRYQIVVFTNQAGLKEPKKESAKLTVFKLKVSAILTVLDIPLHLYAATVKNRFRKPQTGMWSEMIDDLDLDHHGVDLKRSYLVGDAAGREGDFSDSDRYVLHLIGLEWKIDRLDTGL